MTDAPHGLIVSVNLSETKGVSKHPVAVAEFQIDRGVVGDAHAGPGDRQVSLLAEEAIERMRHVFSERLEAGKSGCPADGVVLAPGAFAENVTTRGLDLPRLPIGTRLTLGPEVVLEVTRIGKDCHSHCEIFRKLGSCVMPKEGVFAKVVHGGRAKPGDSVIVERRENR